MNPHDQLLNVLSETLPGELDLQRSRRLQLTVEVTDPEVIDELLRRTEGIERLNNSWK